MTSVSEFMSEDHDRLDRVFVVFGSADERGAVAGAFTEFDEGLRRHIDWEEQILFPEFDRRTGLADSGPTAVMRLEHERIDALLRLIADRLADDSIGGFGAAADELRELLTAHNLKEEMILYPWIDRELSGAEVKAALAAMTGP